MPSKPPQGDAPEGHYPNLTTSASSSDLPPTDAGLPPGTPALPRDPRQPIHKKPRVFIHRPGEDPNEETSAYKNTSWISAARTVNLREDLTKVHQTPCFRDAMLPGIGGGMGLGVVRVVAGGSIFAGMNWACGSFLAIGVGMYGYCQRQRAKEKEGIRKAVKVLDEKQKMKEAEDAAKAKSTVVPSAAAAQSQGQGGSSFWNTFKFW